MTEMTIRETLFEQFGALDNKDQWWFVTKALAALQKTSKVKKNKAAKADSDSESVKPKKEPNEWIKFTQYVRNILKPLADTDPASKKAAAVTQVSKMLKDECKMDPRPTAKDILDTFVHWKTISPSTASASTASASTASASPPASPPASPSLAPTTPVKTVKALEMPPSPPKIKRVLMKKKAITKPEGEAENWEHDFGSGTVSYERFPGPALNTYYVYHPKDGYMGLYNEEENELDATVPDPTLS